jgi:cytidyltransferase-like protein
MSFLNKKIINKGNFNKFYVAIKKNQKIGLCHGAFDILHFGHSDHLVEAKKYCDILVVSITADEFINKGPSQPFFNNLERANFLLSIRYVDFVYISNSQTGEEAINLFKPDCYIKGIDYINKDNDKNLNNEKKACKKNKTKIIFTKTKKYSSTKILNNYFNLNSEKNIKAIKEIKKKYSISEIYKIINKISEKTFVLTGEPILDEYKYIDVLGTATKSPTITSNYIREEFHLGGTLAAVNMMSNFAKKIILLFPTNKKKINYKILKKIQPNVEIKIYNLNFDMPIKTRFVTRVRNNKMFQINNIKQFNPNKNVFDSYLKKINFYQKKHPTLILDFGLGLFSRNSINKLNCKKIYLNVQSNSNNYGFNIFSKYKDFSYLSVNLREFELNFGTKIQKYEEIKNLSKNIHKNFSVTLGDNGSVLINKEKKFFFCPNFYPGAIDTIGCGDAYFVITSFLVSMGYDDQLVPFLGNVYAGLHSKNFGNSRFPSREDLLKSVDSILNF